jgi:hypothetical protein
LIKGANVFTQAVKALLLGNNWSMLRLVQSNVGSVLAVFIYKMLTTVFLCHTKQGSQHTVYCGAGVSAVPAASEPAVYKVKWKSQEGQDCSHE